MKGKMVYHHYTISGLPNVWIRCWRGIDDDGDQVVSIPINRVHPLLAERVVESEGALTGGEIKYLRSHMGLTPAEFAKLVHREESTVARWEHGSGAPDGAMDTLIRMLAAAKLQLNAAPTGFAAKYKPVARKKRIYIDPEAETRKRCAA